MPAAVLGERVALGGGRSIRPPTGWSPSGKVADDELRLQPPDRVLFHPPEGGSASLCWRLADWLVGKEESLDFSLLLDREGQLAPDDVAVLYPRLIRVRPDTITDARVWRHPGAGRVLAITYLIPESGWAGHVLYAPSAQIEGEVQLLSFEGPEVSYLTYLDKALASMRSFRDERLITTEREAGAD